LQAELDQWLAFYQPASPGARAQLETAFFSLVQQRRVHDAQAAAVDHQIRTARQRLDFAQEDQVEAARKLFATDPARGVLLRRRTALGCRWMISRYIRLKSLLDKDGTLYGADRNELINMNGCEAYTYTLVNSEGAYLLWLYCLLAQPEPAEDAIAEMGS